MTSFTLSLPDATYRRLDEIARVRGVSVDELFGRMAAAVVAEADAEARFRARAQRGQGRTERGLELLRRAAGDDESSVDVK
jgi:predicted transcriptional regulator